MEVSIAEKNGAAGEFVFKYTAIQTKTSIYLEQHRIITENTTQQPKAKKKCY